MRIKAFENRVRLALLVSFVAVLLTVGLGLAFYLQASRDLAAQATSLIKVQTALLASRIPVQVSDFDNATLIDRLKGNGVSAHAAIFSSNGQIVAEASTLASPFNRDLPAPVFEIPGLSPPPPEGAGSPVVATYMERTRVKRQNGFIISELVFRPGYLLMLARSDEEAPLPGVLYLFTYQLLLVLAGLAIAVAIGRWLVRPYRRMVEAAQGSPVRAASDSTESEFVVATFKALIDQLQAKEKELAHLHEMERIRADRSERFSEKLIANIPSGLVAIDSQGRMTSANRYAIEMFITGGDGPLPGGAADRGSGELFADQLVPADYLSFFAPSPKLIDLIGDCLNRGTTFRREEVEVNHPNGRTRRVGLSVSPILDPLQRLEGALCLITDLTEVIELRERMKLQETLASLGEMAAGLAHEFKNSLATIHGYVQLLEASAATAGNSRGGPSQQAFDGMLTEVRLLAQLVTDFLNFARPQPLTLAVVDINNVLDVCVDENRARMDEAGILLRKEGSFPPLPGDEGLLRRAFSNLLRNAIEAIDPQSTDKMVRISGSVDNSGGGGSAHILIGDTGVGIADQNRDRIFIPFFTTKSRGYGIGLAIVQKILTAHGGSITVDRSDGRGTIFHCRLPLDAPGVDGMSHPVA